MTEAQVPFDECVRQYQAQTKARAEALAAEQAKAAHDAKRIERVEAAVAEQGATLAEIKALLQGMASKAKA